MPVTMMSDAELVRLRADLQAALLPGTCNILTVTNTPDGQGGFTQTWGTAYSNVACRVDHQQGQEMVVGEGLRPYTFWQFTFPQGTDLDASDRIEIGSDVYTISAVDAGNSWDACLRATGAKM